LSDLIQLIANWPGAALLRRSSLAYLLVNAGHILGIALVLGPILALDARLLGAFRTAPLAIIGPFLSGVAKLGIGLAVVTGLTLFSVGPEDYVDNPAFLAKLALLALAIINAITLDRSQAWHAAIAGNANAARLKLQAAASMMLWLAVLVAGRWIGFV
jgi:hypothetical protein